MYREFKPTNANIKEWSFYIILNFNVEIKAHTHFLTFLHWQVRHHVRRVFWDLHGVSSGTNIFDVKSWVLWPIFQIHSKWPS